MRQEYKFSKDPPTSEQVKAALDAIHDPIFLLFVALLKELNRIGILSDEEGTNVLTGWYGLTDKLDIPDHTRSAIISLLAPMFDERLHELMRKKMEIPD